MNKLLALGLLLVGSAVLAAGTTATVSFLPVTEYTDDTPMPASDVLKYTVKWAGGTQDAASPVQCQNGRLCVDVPVPCGDRAFTVTVTTKPSAKYPSSTAPDSTPPVAYASGVQCGPKAVTGVTAS